MLSGSSTCPESTQKSCAAEPALLAALLRFLEAHEPDLMDVATAVGVEPRDLVAAREELEG